MLNIIFSSKSFFNRFYQKWYNYAKSKNETKKDEIEFIKKEIKKLIEGDIYLFGSRIDDNKLGGDIDIFIILKKKLSIKESMDIKTKIQIILSVDIIISKDLNRDIEKETLKGIKIG